MVDNLLESEELTNNKKGIDRLKNILDTHKVNPTYVTPSTTVKTNPDVVQRRWKILCLVREADLKADETARKEKIKDKVDDWMSSFVSKMRLEARSEPVKGSSSSHPTETEDSSLRDSGLSSANNDFGSNDELYGNVTKSALITRSEIKKSRSGEIKRHEEEQRERMRQRANVEANLERELVLAGKAKLKKEHLQDIRLKVHHDLLKVEKSVKRSRSKSPHGPFISSAKSPKPVRKRSHKSKRKHNVQFKWADAVGKIGGSSHANGLRDSFDDDLHFSDSATETVVASLIYDAPNDKLIEAESVPSALPLFVNPVLKSFENANGVDDLFRIAEVWVNPNLFSEPS